jgi:hypothetical protein
MQYDMHYYGTYALAAAAGIPRDDAQIIAHASQYVDDQDYEVLETVRQEQDDLCEGVIGIPTAHHPVEAGLRTEVQAVINEAISKIPLKRRTDLLGADDSRLVWVPFHFLPGNEGESFHEKLICKKDSNIANEMITSHVTQAKDWCGLELMGIAAHVYADTFAHFGFSGIKSFRNNVNIDSIKLSLKHGPKIRDYIEDKSVTFKKLHGWGENSAHLGHGGVDTCPDRPFLEWEFQYHETGLTEHRDNFKNFAEACEKLYGYFVQFRNARYGDAVPAKITPYETIRPTIENILKFEGTGDERSARWMDAVKNHELGSVEPCKEYDAQVWTEELRAAMRAKDVNRIRNANAYQFHNAADYHRHYVLKKLLPRHGLIVA